MRLIKMSKDLSPSREEVVSYFEDSDSEFRTEDETHGIFYFTKGRISPDGIKPGETLLFSYDGEVVYVAKAASAPLASSGAESAQFPYYLQVDLPSLRKASIPLAQLQRTITDKLGNCPPLTGQGWTRLPDDAAVEAAVNSLVMSLPTTGIRFSNELESRVKEIIEKECSPRRLFLRESAEQEAASIISSHLGTLTSVQLAEVLKLADKDLHNEKEKSGRFGLTFRGANSAKICSNIDAANEVIKKLWEVPEVDLFFLIDKFLKEKPLQGAGIGFYSVIPYLRDPHKFNIWIDIMILSAASIANLPIKKTSENDYRAYNDTVTAFRDHFQLKPQALDIVLTGLYKDNVNKSQFWWVNQGTSYDAESRGGYIFAPLHTDKGASLGHWNNLAKVNKGDVIVHYKDQAIQAISTVTEEAVEVTRPAGSIDGSIGRLVKCSYLPLLAPVYLSSIPVEERIKEGGPFNKIGGVKQAYLLPISKRFVEIITPLVGVDLFHKLQKGLSGSEQLGGGMKKIVKGENKILYGPPGTGKTHYLIEEMKRFLTPASEEPEEAYLARLVADKPLWQIVAAVVLEQGRIKSRDILKHKLIQAKFSGRNLESPDSRIRSTLQLHTVADCPNVKHEKRYDPLIFSKDQSSVWSIDKVLLEESAPEVIDLLERADQRQSSKEIKRYEFITFHQSYGYEEFLEGIRPVMPDVENGDDIEEASEIRYKVQPGVFKRICRSAEKDPEHEYAIFIDEINRGNISKIFGELITLIEHDKRITPDGKGMRVRLPYSKEEFGVPGNLSIIGTMNTADRSIAFIDVALRRRFRFQEMMPEPKVIRESVGSGGVVEGVDVARLLETLNQRIEFLYDRDHMIGHSFFLKCADLEGVKDTLLLDIIPLLQEYFYGDWEKISLVLGCGTNGNIGETANKHPLVRPKKLVEKEFLMLDLAGYEDCRPYEVNSDFIQAEGDVLRKHLIGVYQPKSKAAEPAEG